MNPIHPILAKPQYPASKGQSLIELVLVMPILLVILVGGMTMGMGAYQGHMASDAIRQPVMQKMTFSKNKDAISDADLMTAINNATLKGNLPVGTYVDQIELQDVDAYTTLVIGTKRFMSGVPFLPNFDIRVGQVVNKNLLQAANNGATEVRPYGTPWVPFGTPAAPPWEGVVAPAP